MLEIDKYREREKEKEWAQVEGGDVGEGRADATLNAELNSGLDSILSHQSAPMDILDLPYL